jgi:aminomethyltransferase
MLLFNCHQYNQKHGNFIVLEEKIVALKKTGFYDKHVENNAKLVEFAGYYMPIQYNSILEEHKRVRSTVGLFDVSHMGEIEISGANAPDFINYITINDVSKIEINQAQYTAMCYGDGGIVDDLIVYYFKDHYLLVVNAANTQKDFEWIMENKTNNIDIKNISDNISQLAVQGKKALATLQKLTDIDLSSIKFYWFVEGELAKTPMMISSTGYTGEPGFELYFNSKDSEKVWDQIIKAGKEYDIAPIGLGARDSLRLEKKYCLYGNDIDSSTNPLEAGLGWITKFDKKDFIGKNALLKIKQEGVKRKLMGFEVEGRMIPRHGYEIKKNNEINGFVTSGAFSPILQKNIGLGYVNIMYSSIGEDIEIESNGRSVLAKIVKTPFL